MPLHRPPTAEPACSSAIDAWMSKIDEVTGSGRVLKMVIMSASHQDDVFVEESTLLFNCKPPRTS